MTNLERAEIMRERKRAMERQAKAARLEQFAETDATSRAAREAAIEAQVTTEAKAIRVHRGSSVRTFRAS